MEYALWLVLGTVYGLVIGIIPMAGATTGLLTVFALGDQFLANPYLGIIFLTSLVAASSTGDSFTSILTGIPGSNTTAASIIDGYKMAQQGQAARALGIAIMDSTINGIVWGLIAFALMPFYAKLILIFGTPEFLAFMIIALACVGFIASKNVWLSLTGIGLGIFLGLVGQNPATGVARFTGGWEYLEAGIQIIPLIAGLFGIPEIVEGFRNKTPKAAAITNYWSQLFQGFKDCVIHWRDMMRGGVIGFFTGLLPGIGGTIGDIMAYGATVAKYPNEKFGNGNVKGLLGCEGANNAQKAGSLVPTVLFGIPAAPFAAVMMAICVYFGMELGSPQLLQDEKFLWSLGGAFIISTILVLFISMFTVKLVVKLLEIPYWIYATLILSVIVWSATEYTGTINDLYILILCSILGLICKYAKISRPAVMVSFILAERLEKYSLQTFTLYQPQDLLQRPLFMTLIAVAIVVVVYSLTKKNRGIEYQ
jgi:putative tricarboxylic transport membrane protein